MKLKIRTNETKYMLFELIAILFLATGGIFVKLSELPPISTGFYRVLFSIPILFPMAYKDLKTLSRKDLLILLFAGSFLAGDIALWNLSFSYTSVANANLLANLTPLTVVPVSFFLFKEKIPTLFFPGVGITILGLILLLAGKSSLNPDGYLGDFLSFSASFFYAGFLLISYRLRDQYSSNVILFITGLGCTLTLGVISFFTEQLPIPHGFHQLWPILGLTFCLQIVGHRLFAYCQGSLSVNLSTTLCLTQPVFASVYSFFLFGEKLSGKEVFGILIIILGVYMVKAQYARTKD